MLLLVIGVPCIFWILSLRIMHAKEAVQYMANATEKPQISGVRKYNRAIGKCFIVFGIFLLVLMLPLVFTQSAFFGILMIFLMPFGVIGLLIACMTIQSRYEKK